MLELSVLTNRKPKPKYLIVIVLVVVDLGVMFYFKSSGFVFLLAFFLLLYLFMLLGKNENDTIIGTLRLKNNGIELVLNDFSLFIDPSDFYNTTIIYSGYTGKNVYINSRKYSGTDNRIIYYYKNKKYNFRFWVKNEIEEQEIYRKYNFWLNSGYKVNNFRIDK